MKLLKIQRTKLKVCINILNTIDDQLDLLYEYDIYGDMVQNFEDECRERHTTRLKKMIQEDLNKGR